MRPWLAIALFCLSGCASDKLALMPPAGVDFSGHWKLNEADSDDPRHLAQQRDPSVVPNAPSGGSGGRGGRQGGRGGGQMPGDYAAAAPAMPSMAVLGDALRWPGKQIEIKQVAGVVAFGSDGYDRVCQPTTGGKPHHRPHQDEGRDDRDMDRGRDMPPPRCGWSEKTLMVQGGEPGDDQPPFEEYYSLSDDGQRLVEVVSFRGGRSAGFSMSRVWDRVIPGK